MWEYSAGNTRQADITHSGTLIRSGMEHAVLLLCLTLAGVAPASAAQPAEWIGSLLLAVQKRPWLLGVYVFVVGLPAILFISFMWPDVRFGPPNQDYYYKKSDDVQPDDPEASEVKPTLETDERVDRALTKRK
ncbi:unnamed protein product [Gadus morhua 'NCC']